MTDISDAFRAAVRGVRERAKLPLTAQSDVLKPLRRTPFLSASAALAVETAELRAYLAAHAADYVDANRAVPSLASRMTDAERDAIDQKAALFAGTAAGKLASLGASIGKQGDGPSKPGAKGGAQRKETPSALRHQREVVKCLHAALRDVAKVAERQREARKTLDGMTSLALSEADRQAATRLAAAARRKAARRQAKQQQHQHQQQQSSSSSSSSSSSQPLAGGGAAEPEEDAGLAAENAALQAQLEGAVLNVRQVEEQVAQVSNLFAVFSNEVINQHEMVSQIEEDAEESKEQVEKGNEELARNEKSLSFVALFTTLFLYSAGFLVLFVHWFLP